MTETERIDRLYAIKKGHGVLACRIFGCPICKRYYAILLTPTAPAAPAAPAPTRRA